MNALTKTGAFKAAALFTIFIFTSQQILMAAPPSVILRTSTQASDEGPQPVVIASEAKQSTPIDPKVPGTLGRTQASTDFLMDSSSLRAIEGSEAITPLSGSETISDSEIASSSVGSSPRNDVDRDYVRYTVDQAIDLFSPDYAAAVVLEDLTETDIQKLLDLPFEVGIAVLEGEIVVFTTGNEEEIGILEPARKLLENAAFISHTHVTSFSQDGPSQFDLIHAVESPSVEYVITREGVYAYNRDGVVESLSLRGTAQLAEAISDLPAGQAGIASRPSAARNDASVEARSLLNTFIHQMDVYNRTSDAVHEIFRRSAEPDFFDDFNRPQAVGSNWTVHEAWFSIKDNAQLYQGGSWPNVVNGLITLNVPLESADYETQAGFQFGSSSTPRGIVLRFQDSQNYYYGRITNYNSAKIIKVENGVATDLATQSISGLAAWSWHTIKMKAEGDHLELYLDGNLVVQADDSTFSTGTVGIKSEAYNLRFDNFSVTTLGSTPPPPPPVAPSKPVVTSSPPTATNQNPFTISGTTDQGTSVTVNGNPAVMTSATSWSYEINFPEEGEHLFSIMAVDSDDPANVSVSHDMTITLDQTYPTGTVLITADQEFSTTPDVTLTITQTEENPDKMRISLDGGLSWGAGWVPFEANQSVTLPAGDGQKTVVVELMDKAGNVSVPGTIQDTIYIYSSELDTAREDLTARLGIPANDPLDSLRVASVEEVSWPDPNLGITEGEEVAITPVIVPGYRIVFEYLGAVNFIYHTSRGEQDLVKLNARASAASLIELAKEDLQGRLPGPFPPELEPTEVHYRVWPNWGILTVLTPGWEITFTVDGQIYRYQTDLDDGVIFDTESLPPPAPAIDQSPSLLTKDNPVILSGTMVSGVTSVQVDGNQANLDTVNGTWSYSFALSGEGLYTVNVVASDGTLNSDPATIDITLDQTAPTATVVINGGIAETDQLDVALNISNLTDSFSQVGSVEYSWTGNAGDWTPFLDINNLPAAITLPDLDGDYQLHLRLTDTLGNQREDILSNLITLDRSVPPPPDSQTVETILTGQSSDWTDHGGSLSTPWQGKYLIYTADIPVSGDYQLKVLAKNYNGNPSWHLPSGYTNFLVDVHLDGVLQGTLAIPASDTDYQEGMMELMGLTPGAHQIKLTWKNDAYNANESGDANIQISQVWLEGEAAPPVVPNKPAVTSNPPPEPILAEPGLIGYWNFEEMSGGQVSDGSGSNLTGTLVNGTAFDPGHPSLNYPNTGSLKFDGVNDYVQIPSHSSLNFGADDFTISIWIKPDTVTTPKQGMINKTDGTNGYRLITSDTDGDRLKFIRGALFAEGIQSNDGALTAGVWQHVSVVISNHQVTFYVNGVHQGGGALASRSASSSADLFIGQKGYSNSTVNFFDGNIDEVQFFNRSLSFEEIQTLAAGNHLTPPEPDPAPDEVTLSDGTVLHDESGVLVKEVTPDLDEIFYGPDGKTERYVYLDGTEIRYREPGTVPEWGLSLYDETGQWIETILSPEAAALDENQALRLSLEGGINAYYLSGNLVEFRTATGIRVTDFTLDAENNIVDALITYPDGARDVIRRGSLIRRIQADGTLVDGTPSGFVVREVVQGQSSFYAYEKLSQTEVSSTRIFTETGGESVYDELGILSEVRDGTRVYLYDRTESTEIMTTLDLVNSSAPEDQALVEARYTLEGQLTQMKLQNGTQVDFTDGKISRVLDATGVPVADYSYLEENGILDGLQVTRGATEFLYTDTGFLRGVATEDGTIHRIGPRNDEMTEIELILEDLNGNKLFDFELDPDGNILNGIIETQEGIKQKIEAGILTGFETVDGRNYSVQGSEAILTEWNFKDGTRVLFAPGTGSEITVDQILFPNETSIHSLTFGSNKEIETFVEVDPDGNEKHYVTIHEAGGQKRIQLEKVATSNGNEIRYDSKGRAVSVTLAGDGDFEVSTSWRHNDKDILETITFTKPGATEHAVEQRLTFAPDGTLRSILNQGVNATVEAGELTDLFTRFGSVANPQFNAGTLTGIIDYVDGSKLNVDAGNLTQTIRANGTKVNYVNGRIDSIEIAGKPYQLTYLENAGVLEDIRVSFDSEDGPMDFSLIPFLEDPDTLYEFETVGFVPEFPVSYHGDSEITATESKIGTGSAAFDGSGDFLSVPDSDDFDFGAGEFTIDFWAKFNSLEMPQILAEKFTGTQDGYSLYVSGGQLTFYADFGAVVISSLAPLLTGVWQHIAVVRKGNLFSLYVNGVLQDSQDAAVTLSNQPTSFTIGTRNKNPSNAHVDGYLDEFRVSKGAARWDTDFSNALPVDGHTFDETTKLLLKFEPELEGPSELGLIAGELAGILTPRPLHNALEDRFGVQSVYHEAQTENTVFFAALTLDPERGEAFEVGGDYVPEWRNVSLNHTAWDDGGIAQDRVAGGEWDDLPSLVSTLADMDGDGLADRVFADPSGTDWWVQFNDGQQFLTPVLWDGVQGLGSSTQEKYIRYFYGRHPQEYGKLVDINGDGRPDRVLQKLTLEPEWYVQINNGLGFDPITLWADNVQILSIAASHGRHAATARDNSFLKDIQELVADLVDMDGDGLLDRVVRPFAGSFDTWIVQKNLGGNGFADGLPWAGVDPGFYEGDERMGAALSWYAYSGSPGDVADLADLIDLNGDGLPDRVLLKNKIPGDPDSAMDWYVQWNNGVGFEPAQLWDNAVFIAPGMVNRKTATAIRVFKGWNAPRDGVVDLRDVTGDGLVDRVSMDGTNGLLRTSWWVEENTGISCAEVVAGPCGFKAPVEWTGIAGANASQTSMTQDTENYHTQNPLGSTPELVRKAADLTDINGDGILDRVLFTDGEDSWQVQLGTGSGFLPVEEFKIQGLVAPTETIASSRYDYLHVSLKAAQNIPAVDGSLHVILSEAGEVIEQWTLSNLTPEWQDFYLPIDAAKPDASEVTLRYLPANEGPLPSIYVDNVTFTAFRPNAEKDWLDRLLTEESVLDIVNAQSTETLASLLSVIASPAQSGEAISGIASPASGLHAMTNWKDILTAETRIEFDTEGETIGFDSFSGSHSTVVSNQVMQTVMADGTTIDYDSAASTQTITDGESNQTVEYQYGRIRSVQENGVPKLEYSYEFNANGEEITVVRDLENNVTERYLNSLVIQRTSAAGVETHFTYNSDGELVQSQIIYKDRVRNTFLHGATADGNTTLATEDGLTEVYDSQGNILYHITPEGFRYDHRFETAKTPVLNLNPTTLELLDPEFDENLWDVPTSYTYDLPAVELVDCTADCTEVHQVRLAGYNAPNGEIVDYDKEVLKGITLTDGTYLSFSRFEQAGNVDPETGEHTREIRLLDAAVFHPDGSITEFKDGAPFKITGATGMEIDISKDSTGELINPNESAAFHHKEALKYWDETLNPKWMDYQLPGALVVQSEYGTEGDLVTLEYAEGAVELHSEGHIDQMLASNGEVLVSYSYDSNGELTGVYMGGARRGLTASILELKAQIVLERAEADSTVREREEVIELTIESEFLVIRNRLLQIRQQLEDQKRLVAGISVKGKAGRSTISHAQQQIQDGLNQVNGALIQVAENREQSLMDLGGQVQEALNEIALQSQEAIDEVEAKELEVRDDILRQEIAPVLTHWYRKVLGRDPSETEIEDKVGIADYETGGFGAAGLKTELESFPEFTQRQNEVAAIQSGVVNELNTYVNAGETGQAAYLSELGLDPSLVVDFTSEDISKMQDWMSQASLHFGQSAFYALEVLLAAATIPLPPREELAAKMITIDILTGTLTDLETSDLILSLFSMRLIAARYGLNVTSYAMSYDALVEMFKEECPQIDTPAAPGEEPPVCDFRVVVHVDGNHYIILTGFEKRMNEDGSIGEFVNFVDPGIGADGTQVEQQISKEEFLGIWIDTKSTTICHPEQSEGSQCFGYVLSPRPPPSEITTPEGTVEMTSQFRVLDAEEEMQVRGSFFGLIALAIFAIVNAVIAAVTAVVAAVVAIISALLSVIGTILSTIGQFIAALGGQFLTALGNIFQGVLAGIGNIATAAFNGLVQFGGALFNTVGGFLQSVIGGFKALAAVKVGGFTVGGFIKGTLFGAGVGFAAQGVAKILDVIGISPKVTATIMAGGKIVAGVALLATGNPVGLAFVGGGTAELLNMHTNLSPTMTTLIGIGASALGALAGGFIDTGSLSGALSGLASNLPALSMDLATFGLTAIGNELGLDPRITALISVPVRAGLGGLVNGIGSDGGVLNSIKDSLFSNQTLGGLVSVGASIALDAVGAPAVVQNFIPGILGQLVASAGGNTGGGGGPGDPSVNNTGNNLFKRLVDGVAKFGKGVVSTVGTVISFGAKVVEGVGSITKAGFKSAIKVFSGIFDRQTQEKFNQLDVQDAWDAKITIDGDRATLTDGDLSLEWSQSLDKLTYNSANVEFEGVGVGQGEFGDFFGSIAYAEEIADASLIEPNAQAGIQMKHIVDATGNSVEILQNNEALIRFGANANGDLTFGQGGSIIDGTVQMPFEEWEIDNGAVKFQKIYEQVYSDTTINVEGVNETTLWIKSEELIAAGIGTGTELARQVGFSTEAVEFVHDAVALGAEYLDYGNGLVSVVVKHDLGASLVDMTKEYLSDAYNAGKHIFNQVVKFGNMVINTAEEVIDQSLDFLGITFDPAAVEKYASRVAEIDMALDWQGRYFVEGEGLVQTVLDIPTTAIAAATGNLGQAPANIRWSQSVKEAGPKIANIIHEGESDFISVPGVNSEGLTESEMLEMKSKINLPGKTVVFCHSAGTEACTESLQYLTATDKQNVVYVFASPRMTFSQFDSKVAASGLQQDQVIVITSSKDLLHWADPTTIDISTGGVGGILNEVLEGGIKDYGENPNPTYHYMFLEDDVTLGVSDSEKILDHGSMFNGVLEDHRYDIEVDGSSRNDVSIEEIVRKLANGEDL